MAATCLPLPQPVPSPSIQPRRKRDGIGQRLVGVDGLAAILRSWNAVIAVGVDALHRLPARADAVLGGELALVRLAGEDDALELGVGQQPLGHHALGQHRAVGRHGVL